MTKVFILLNCALHFLYRNCRKSERDEFPEMHQRNTWIVRIAEIALTYLAVIITKLESFLQFRKITSRGNIVKKFSLSILADIDIVSLLLHISTAHQLNALLNILVLPIHNFLMKLAIMTLAYRALPDN